MRQTRLVATVAVAAALLMAPVTARAASFTVDASREVVPGGSVDFTATLTMSPGDPDPLYLIGISITFSGQGLTTDDSAFFTDWPLQLDSSIPGVSDTFTGRLFTVSADPTAVPPGPYVGSVLLTLGGDLVDDFDTDWQQFEVTVRGGPAIPEPATMALLGFGLAGLAIRRRMAR